MEQNRTCARMLLWVNAFFLLSSFLSGMFVNVFLWKQSNSLIPLALFNGTQYFVLPLVFRGASLLKRMSAAVSIQCGLVFTALFYSVVIFFKHGTNPYLIGVLLGIGAGGYWYGFNLLSFRMIKGEDRPRFNSQMGIIAAAAGIVSPMLSGFIISRFPPIGYSLVFGTSLAALGISLLISFWIRPENEDRPLPPAPLFQRRHPNWSRALLSNALQGGREGVFFFFSAILVFMATGSEWALGNFSAWTALLSSVSFYTVGKWVKTTWYNESMLASSLLSTAVIGVFLWGTTPFTILAYGVITALTTPLFAVPFGTRVFQIIDEAHEKHEKEYMVEREIVLNLGRVISIVSFIAAYRYFPREWIPVYLLVIGSFQVAAVLVFRRASLQVKLPTG